MGWSASCSAEVVCTKARDGFGRKLGLVLSECHDKFGFFFLFLPHLSYFSKPIMHITNLHGIQR